MALVTALFAAPAWSQQAGAVPPTGSAYQNLNPEIGVVADIVGRATEVDDEEGADQFSFREAEVVFGGFVDPFTRADLAFVFSELEESAEIEEAFITFFNLPLGFRGKVGKFRSRIGRINLKDLNALPFVTEPEVIRHYFGEEGMARTGIQLSHLIPAGPLFLELSGELLDGGRGEEKPLAISSAGSDPTFVVHLRSFADLSERTSLEAGFTWIRADNNRLDEIDPLSGDIVLGNPFGMTAHGVDLTYRWRKSRFRDVTVRFEGYRVDRGLDALQVAGLNERDGFYLHGDYRFHPRWSAGSRYDRVEPLEAQPVPVRDRVEGHATYVTFHQSEFALIRLQYQRTDEINGLQNDELFLQFRIQIGVDRHGLQ